MSSDSASRLLELAWKRVDRDGNQGFIFADDLPYLIEVIDSILKKTLLNETGQRIIRDFSSKDPTRRVYKREFSALFEGLVGVTFESAVDAVGFKSASSKDELKFDTSVRKSAFNRDPFSDDNVGADIPDFKKEYKKFERLSTVKDDEIKYRDEIIQRLEKSQSQLRNNEKKIRELQNLNDSLEEDVLYRDNVINSKQNEIEALNEKISFLEQNIIILQKEIHNNKPNDSSASLQLQMKQRQQFNKELLSRVKSQQELIISLQKALSEKKEVIVSKPVRIESKISNHNEAFPFVLPSTLQLIRTPLFTGLILTFVLILLVKYTHSDWKNSVIEQILTNEDIDYDHYNLGDVESDFLI